MKPRAVEFPARAHELHPLAKRVLLVERDYSVRSPVVQAMTLGRDVFVVGAGNSAGQAALHLARYARQVTMVVRGDSLARSMVVRLTHEYLTAGHTDELSPAPRDD